MVPVIFGLLPRDLVLSHSPILKSKITSSLTGPIDQKYMLNFHFVNRHSQGADNNQAVATLKHPIFNDTFLVNTSNPHDSPAVDSSSDPIINAQPILVAAQQSTNLPVLSLVAKRMGLSGRRTLGLQETGLATIHKQYRNEEITHDPVLYGYDEHYPSWCLAW